MCNVFGVVCCLLLFVVLCGWCLYGVCCCSLCVVACCCLLFEVWLVVVVRCHLSLFGVLMLCDWLLLLCVVVRGVFAHVCCCLCFVAGCCLVLAGCLLAVVCRRVCLLLFAVG